jgi:hypothetical protein
MVRVGSCCDEGLVTGPESVFREVGFLMGRGIQLIP